MANTGIKNVLTLRKYVNGVATSEFKANTLGDPDYISPYQDLVDCPVESTTTTSTTIAPCVSGLTAVVCGYSSATADEACLQNNVVIVYKTELWLDPSNVVYSTSDGCNVTPGFYAPLPGEEGDGSVFQIDQYGDTIGSANCDGGITEPPTVYTVGFRTLSSAPISSFACNTADQTLYASTPLFSNVTIGTKIYADELGTPLQGGDLWFGIASASGDSTKTILVSNTGLVTNDDTCEVTVTTTTQSPFIGYLVTYDEFNEQTACNNTTEITVYSQCSPITLPGVGQCYLYNTPNTQDLVAPGYYADVATGNYYYVENNGLVEEILSCGASTTTTTTSTLPPCNSVSITVNTYADLSSACQGGAGGTLQQNKTNGDPNNPQIGDIIYTDSECTDVKAAGIYFHSNATAAIEVGGSGNITSILLC